MLEKFSFPLIGGFLAGIAASLCCVAPLILLSLGIGGAWVSRVGWVAALSQPNEYHKCWVAKKTATQPTQLMSEVNHVFMLFKSCH